VPEFAKIIMIEEIDTVTSFISKLTVKQSFCLSLRKVITN